MLELRSHETTVLMCYMFLLLWAFFYTAYCFSDLMTLQLSYFLPYCLLLQRIRMEEIRKDDWFNKGYTPVSLIEYEDLNLDDINAVFDDTEVGANLSNTSSATASFA